MNFKELISSDTISDNWRKVKRVSLSLFGLLTYAQQIGVIPENMQKYVNVAILVTGGLAGVSQFNRGKK